MLIERIRHDLLILAGIGCALILSYHLNLPASPFIGLN
jgi:hypothetical protein